MYTNNLPKVLLHGLLNSLSVREARLGSDRFRSRSQGGESSARKYKLAGRVRQIRMPRDGILGVLQAPFRTLGVDVG